MAIIRVNLNKLRADLAQVAPTDADMKRLVRGVAAVARARWVALAQQGLHTSARDYIGGIQQIEMKGNAASVSLLGQVPNMIEEGMSAFDMRTTLLGPDAKNAKTAKDGSRYNVVPFRHGTPGSSGRNVGNPMPKSIHAAAKKLEATVSRPGGGTKWGGRLEPGAKMSNAARAILQRKEKPWHASSIYMGMVRKEKTYAKATQSSYTTFRTISSKVRRAKEHWLHPGITARRFARKVQREIGAIVNDLIGASMQKGK